ncbi:hypothetical protein BHE74_00049738 [Ensete ventricosum]|nr:hypothetical protein BHE74_00049738 [Ensete ventricosum]
MRPPVDSGRHERDGVGRTRVHGTMLRLNMRKRKEAGQFHPYDQEPSRITRLISSRGWFAESLKCSSWEPRASRTPTSSVRSLSSTKDPIFDPLFHDLIRSANKNFSFLTNIVDFLAFLPFLDLAFALVLDFGIRCNMDPYAVLTCRTQEQKSSVASGCIDTGKGSDPEWNESFVFTVSDSVPELTIKLMDSDTGSSDDFVGEAM